MKVNIKTKLLSQNKKDNYTIIGNLNDNKLFYKEDNTNVTFDLKNNILIRDNESIYMEYKFKKKETTNNYILIKELSDKVYMNIITNLLEKGKGYIRIEYKIIESEETFYYEINYTGE